MWQFIGHQETIELLDRSLQAGRLAHAYLLVGPPRVGKMTLALDLARAINCQGTEVPCQTCRPCQRITTGNHADVQIVGLAAEEKGGEGRQRKEIGIDQVRSLQHDAQLQPFEGRQRVFILDGAERLSLPAANALLKTLEEPPPHVSLLLLAANDKLLPTTVISRCQRLELRPLSVGQAEQALRERWQTEPKQAKLLARLSGGRLGWAVTALTDERVLAERQDRLHELANLTGCSRAERFAYAASLANRFTRERATVQEVLDLWIGWWRDLLLVRSGCPNLVANVDQAESLAVQAQVVSLAQIKLFLEDLQSAVRQLDQNVNPRLALEALMLRLPHS